MEGDQVYMDDFTAQCYALYVEDHSTDSLPSDRIAIWPLSEQGYCRYKQVTNAISREYKRRLQTEYFTTGYVDSMRTPMAELLRQISNLQPVIEQQRCECKDNWLERLFAWIDRKLNKENTVKKTEKVS